MNYTIAQAHYDSMVALCGNQVKYVHWYYEASIVTEQGDHRVDGVLAIDTDRNFISGFTDHMVVTLRMTKAFYIEKVYPSRDNFKLKLKRTQVPEREEGVILDNKVVEEDVYRGVLVNPINYGNDSSGNTTPYEMTDTNAPNQYIEVAVQCLIPNVEKLMKMTFGGIFHGVPGDVVKGMLSEAFSHVPGDISKKKVTGVDMVTPDNQTKYENILIPHGTRLIDLPRLVQSQFYGIYNYGIGSYITDNWWFLYPLFNHSRYDKEKVRLNISILPKSHGMDLRRTYSIYGDEVNVICTGGNKQVDESNASAINKGDGMRFYDTTKVKQDTLQKDDTGVYISNEASAKSMVLAKREDDMNYYRTVSGRLNSSLALVQSELAQNNTVSMTLIWEHAHPMLLRPGMPTRVTYYVGNTRYDINGTLVGVKGLVQQAGRASNKRHTCTAGLVIAVDKATVKKTEDKQMGEFKKGSSGGLLDTLKSWF